MKRKVIKQANSAYTLTLPIEWVRTNSLNEKSEVDVLVDGRRLVISNQVNVVGKKVKIDVSGFNKRDLYKYINALYAVGIDELEVLSSEDISSDLIHLLNSLIGYVLVSSEDNKFLIKDVGGSVGSNLDEVLKRVFQAVILFYDSAIKDIFGAEKETQESLRMRDLEVNKLCLYLQRAINKMACGDPIKGRAMFAFSYELEKLGDDILRLWRTNIISKKGKNLSLKKMAELSLKCLEGAFDFHYMFDSKRGKDVFEIKEKVRREMASLKGTGDSAGYILKIAEEAVDLGHLTLMMNLE